MAPKISQILFLLNLGLDQVHFKPAWQASKREGRGVKKDRKGRDSRFSPSPFPLFALATQVTDMSNAISFLFFFVCFSI